MKTFSCLVVAALMFCGCQPRQAEKPAIQKWEYKVIEVENFDHWMAQSAYTNNIDLKGIRDANNGPGQFPIMLNAEIDLGLQAIAEGKDYTGKLTILFTLGNAELVAEIERLGKLYQRR